MLGCFCHFLEKWRKIATKKPSLHIYPSAEFSLHPQRALFDFGIATLDKQQHSEPIQVRGSRRAHREKGRPGRLALGSAIFPPFSKKGE